MSNNTSHENTSHQHSIISIQLARTSANSPKNTNKITGIKRNHENSVSDYRQEQMDFIKQAFAYQQAALELRYDQEDQTRSLEAEGKAENEILKHEEKKATEYIKKMELELEEYEAEIKKNNLLKAKHIQAIKIFTGMCTQQDCITPFCNTHTRFSGFT